MTTTNPSYGVRNDGTVDDVSMSLDTTTTTASPFEHLASQPASAPLSPTLRPSESILVPPNSPEPLWRCCIRLSQMDLSGDDVDSDDADHRGETTSSSGITRADLSFLQADNPVVPGLESWFRTTTTTTSTIPRRVSDDFAPTNENSATTINAPAPTSSSLLLPSSSSSCQAPPKQEEQIIVSQPTVVSLWCGNANKQNLHSMTTSTTTMTTRHGGWESSWDNFVVRDIPIFYFMEPSSSLLLHVRLHPPELVVQRISECLYCTSVQARYFSDPAAAALLTLEHVEMYLGLWLNKSNQLVVDLQRRRGDSSVFLRYCRLILSAARGEFDAVAHEQRVRNASLNSDWQETLKSAEMVLQQATTTTTTTTTTSTQALDYTNLGSLAAPESCPSRSVAVVAMVANSISKDDSDARHLGMETACVLTDPRRTGISTAVMISRVVVLGILPGEQGMALGDVCKQINLTLLVLIMTRSFPGQNSSSNINKTTTTSTNNNANNPMVLLEDDMEMDDYNECFFSDEEHPTEQSEFTSRMFHRALQVLANSLEVLANFECLEPERTTSPELFLQELVEAFVAHANRLVPENGNLIRTLLGECKRAEQQPHNAYLAAKILKYLCGASKSLVAAVLEDHGLEFLTLAHQVGQKAHLCLQLETEQLLVRLQARRRGIK